MCVGGVASLLVACSAPASGDADNYRGAAQAATGLSGFAEDLAAAEQAKRECMADLGFEYEPAVAPAGTQLENLPATLLLEGPDSVPNGYGASAFYQRAVLVGATGTNLSQLREELPPEQFEAYIHALTGPDGSGGCEERAAEAAPLRAVRGSFIEAASEMHAQVLADPRWMAATRGWSDCMAEAGYDFPDMPAARNHVGNRIERELGPPAEVGNDPDKLATMAAIFDEERRIARQDALCQQRQADEFRTVWNEYAAEFAQAHEDLIGALLAAERSPDD